ncbi:hypothetical protein CHS0354_004990 [Potamilus streckersoni]|uniref:Uncharacterized protein n=1 Tax=Potamilus streckersoni TaxID=2493646 RepID=A0AAE0SSS0_9BIVA|nr:hypothetical protein CHS0354_004990 [Potamilus streckersoni]
MVYKDIRLPISQSIELDACLCLYNDVSLEENDTTMSLFLTFVTLLTASCCLGTHFRGGIFTWTPTELESQIMISYRVSWRRSSGSSHFCNDRVISSGQLLPGEGSIVCSEGCNGTVSQLQYYCTDYSESEDWSTGTRTIRYNLTTTSPIIVFTFTSCCWINLVAATSWDWSLQARANVTRRSDTGKLNSSPRTSVSPIVRIAHGCYATINLLASDPDGDLVRCRWSIGSNECGGICLAFPGAILKEDTCSITYNASRNVGYYGVAVQVEDFPSTGSKIPYSSVPVQFLVQVYSTTQGCYSLPEFIPPTRSDKEVVYVSANSIYFDKIVAISNVDDKRIVEITTVSPSGFIKSSLAEYYDVSGAWYVNISWTPSTSDANKMHILCFTATDEVGLTSQQRCINLIVPPDIVVNGTERIQFQYGPTNGDSMLGVNNGKCKHILNEYKFPMFRTNLSNIYVCVTGIVTFDKIFESPGTIEGSNLEGRTVLAPYFTDIDIESLRYGGRVYYQVHYSLKGAINGSSNVKTAEQIIRKIHQDVGDFEAQFALFVTWHEVLPSTATSRQNEKMSFQLALVTDGTYTFSFYVYLKDSMKLRSHQVYIGYTTKDGQKYMDYRSFTSPVRSIDSSAISFGYTGILHYRLTFPSLKSKTSRQKCINWYLKEREHEEEIREGLNRMPLCPCNSFHLRQDRFYSRTDYFYQGDAVCTYILPNWQFRPKESGKTCCYHKIYNYFLGYGIDAGGFIRYHPHMRPLNHSSYDIDMRKFCCVENQLCSLYHSVRPIGQCYIIFPPWHAPAHGDPHITTLDGQNYTFNGWGEFTLLRINSSTEEFELQARTSRAVTKDGNMSDATVFSAFAAVDKNGANVHAEMNTAKNGLVVYARMVPGLTLNDYTADYMNMMANFTVATEYLSLSRNIESKNLIAVFSSGIAFTIGVSFEMLNIDVVIPRTFHGKTAGLMGNFDGNPANDFQFKNGTILSEKIHDKDIFEFGKTWAVEPNKSAFWYPRGTGYNDYSHLNYTPKFLADADGTKVAYATNFCGSREHECIFDLVFTDNEAVANETKRLLHVSVEMNKLLANQVPSINGPIIVNVTANQAVTYPVNATDDGILRFLLLDGHGHANITNQNNRTALVTLLLKDDNPINVIVTVIDEFNVQATPHQPIVVFCSTCNQKGTCDFAEYRDDDRSSDTFKYATCSCDPYWEGPECEFDKNGCASQPCSPLRQCTDIQADIHQSSGIGYNCSECPAGFLSMDDGRCEDIDECNSANGGCLQRCDNTYGSFICSCFQGFRKPVGSNICQDINECFDGTNNCDQICTNDFGGYNCSCFEGFVYNSMARKCEVENIPVGCTFLDCNGTNGCTTDEHGNATCFCAKGFQLNFDGTKCVDINECQLGLCQHRCTNTEGRFYCSCYDGYILETDKLSCMPCAFPTYGPNCNNTCDCGQGGIRCDHIKGCICSEGWTGKNCDEDIDECKVPKMCNDSYKYCANTNGSYNCHCINGYTLNTHGSCEDVNECNDPELNTCQQVCNNEIGGFSCSCRSGYVQSNNFTNLCEDVNECLVGQAGCQQICENGDGRYTCSCYFGYILNNDRKTCTQVQDPCSQFANLTCSQICVLENKQVFCSCAIGYKLKSDNQTCEDVNECEDTMLNKCSNNCTNTEGGYICSCPDGFHLDNDGRRCIVCDPFHYGLNCSLPCNCGIGADRCDHKTGCLCKQGWTGIQCNQDIDECTSHPCIGVNSRCINTLGSYICDCLPGFNNISSVCQDVNECDDGRLNECTQICQNSIGSYSCFCHDGFFLNGTLCHVCDKFHYGPNCSQPCNCGIGADRCDQKTGCICKPGFTNTRCDQDIDECASHPCKGANSTCINTMGSYVCDCLPGFRNVSSACQACTENTFGNNCSSSCTCNISNSLNEKQTCNPVNGTCLCKKGWMGARCSQDINECELEPGVCHNISNSGCYNMHGSFLCSCHIGYKLNGSECVEAEYTSIRCSIAVDFTLLPSIDIKVPENYAKIESDSGNALSDFYRRKLAQMFVRIVIFAISRGSLILDYSIITKNSDEAILKLAEANANLASGEKFQLAGEEISTLRLVVKGKELPTDTTTEKLLCTSYLSVVGVCASGKECIIIDKRPACVLRKQEDSTLLYVAIGTGAAFFVLLCLVVTVVVLRAKKSRQKYMPKKDDLQKIGTNN